MSQDPIGDGIRSYGETIAQNVSHYHQLPPHKKARYRAGAGAGLVVLALYAVIGRRSEMWHGPLPLAIWCAVVGFGLLWFFVGINGPRTPVDVMSAFWSVIAVAAFGFLTFAGAQMLDGTDSSFYLEGIFAAFLAGSIVRLWLAVRGMPRAGLDQVRAQQAHGRARVATPDEAAVRLGKEAPRPRRRFPD